MALGALIHLAGPHRRSGGSGQARAEEAASPATPQEQRDDARERALRELTAAALLVGRGVATRVLVCNTPGRIDFDEVRLLADTFSVTVEPIVRVGGGGFDFVVRRETDTGE